MYVSHETATEIVSAVKSGELLLLLCPKEEKIKCCFVLLFSLPLKGRNNSETTVGYQYIAVHNYSNCKYFGWTNI